MSVNIKIALCFSLATVLFMACFLSSEVFAVVLTASVAKMFITNETFNHYFDNVVEFLINK